VRSKRPEKSAFPCSEGGAGGYSASVAVATSWPSTIRV
jgi:hypothetical protein